MGGGPRRQGATTGAEEMQERFLGPLLTAVAAAVVLFVSVSRIGYPFELEWMESGTLQHVQRVADGRPIYVEPSLEFVPYIYTPLYYWVSGRLLWRPGDGLAPLRLLSLISALLCAALVRALARTILGPRRTARRLADLAPALFLLSYGLSGTWFDLARIDSFALMLALAAVWLFARGRGAPDGRLRVPLLLAAGIAAAAACLAKQASLPAMLLLALLSLLRLTPEDSLRHRLPVPLAFLLPMLGVGLLLELGSGGWFSYYVIRIPMEHRILPGFLLYRFWLMDMLMPLPVALALAAAGYWSLWRGSGEGWRKRPNPENVTAVALLAMLVSSWAGRAHSGGYLNVLMPAHAAMAVMAPVGYRHLERVLRGQPRPAGRRARILPLAVMLQAGLMLGVTLSAKRVPDAGDRAAGTRLVQLIERFPGEVLVPYHPLYATAAGKTCFAHDMAVTDVLRAGLPPVSDMLESELMLAFEERRFDAIVLDEPWFFTERLELCYRIVPFPPVYPAEETLLPVTGMRTRPAILMVPRD